MVAIDREDLNKERAERYERRIASVKQWDPAVGDLLRTYIDTMYSREVIDQKTRELCAVASLTVLSQPWALRNHIINALRFGAEPEEVVEVILQQGTVAGFVVVFEGLRVWKEVHDDLAQRQRH